MAGPTLADLEAEARRRGLLTDSPGEGEVKPTYQGAPDLPLEDVGPSDKTTAALLRILGPLLGGMTAPAGLIGSMVYNAGAGALSQKAAADVEGEPSGLPMAAGAVTGAASVPVGRILGALGGVAASKMGLKSASGDVDLSELKDMAGNVVNAKGLVGPRASGAAEKIKEWLDASGGTLPANAPNFQPSAEAIRKGIPWRQAGGREMYGAMREGAAASNPGYDTLLRQYAAMHQLTDIPSMKEIVGSMALGRAGYEANPWMALMALLPRLYNSAAVAPAAPILQGGISGATQSAPSLLRALQ